MTEENIIYMAFAALPVIAAIGIYLFFRRYRLHRGESSSMLRLLGGNALVFVFLASAFLLAGESYFRFWYDTPDSFGLMKTSNRWFQRHYQRNNAGFRDNVSYRNRSPASAQRVTFLGDSFTAGHGIKNVENRFANLIRASHPEWDVHCLAKNGWGTYHQIVKLGKLVGVYDDAARKVKLRSDPSGRLILGTDGQGHLRLGRDPQGRLVVREPPTGGAGDLRFLDPPADTSADHYQFDTVVLVYCLNDIADLVPEERSVLDRIYEASQPSWLAQHSYALNVLHYRLFAARDPDIDEYYSFTHRAYDVESRIWEIQAKRLTAINRLVTTGGGRLLVVTFPMLDQLGSDAYRYADAHRMLDAHWQSLGVPHLDLLSIYAEFDPVAITVHRFDAHPNERAHQMAAEAIPNFIKINLP